MEDQYGKGYGQQQQMQGYGQQPMPGYGPPPGYGPQPGYGPPGGQQMYGGPPMPGGPPMMGGPPQGGENTNTNAKKHTKYAANNKKGASWMPVPQQHNPDCPPGLEYLMMVDQLLVHQQVELFEALVGWETENKYEIKNSLGQRVFFAAEDTCCLWRMCCGKERPFDVNIINSLGKAVMRLHAPLRCDTCWFPCCLKKVVVEAPPGVVIGTVQQTWSICKPQFAICNENGDPILRIKGPCCTFSICGDVEFQVYTADGQVPCGQIRKQFTGLVKEMFTDADNFGVTFPMDLDVKIKASLLAAVFLIDFMFFEKEQNKENLDVGMF